MVHDGIEFHNVEERLTGDVTSVMPPHALAVILNANKNEGEPLSREMGPGQWFCRIPDGLRRKLNPLAVVRALQSTGCELRFNLESASATVTLKSVGEASVAEVYQGPFLVGWHMVGPQPIAIRIGAAPQTAELQRVAQAHRLPFDAGLMRLVLPYRRFVRLLDVQGRFSPPQRGQTPGRTLLIYGSSITHGYSAVHPAATYAARTAGRLDMDLINLGFGGGAHLEPELAEYIASRNDWHVAVVELGINLLGGIDVEEFERRVRRFVPTLAQARPERWIFCIDLFTCGRDLSGDPKAGAFREVVRRVVAKMGCPRCVHLDGRALLPSPQGLTTDLTHPSPFGMEQIAENLAAEIRARLAQEEKT